MAEAPPKVHFGTDNEDDDAEDEDCVNTESVWCDKLELPDNIAAFLENRELIRDTQAIMCDQNLVDKVISNYIIVKKIIGNLSWQDKLMCKLVCTTWLSAVRALEKEQLRPVDFVIDLQCCPVRGGIKYKQSAGCYTEPMAVLTFANTAGFGITCKCEDLNPSPCMPPCNKEHCLMDLVQQHVSIPKDCMLTVKASYLSYMPLPHSLTYEHKLTHHALVRSKPFISGVYIPKIPEVEFHMINVKSDSTLQQDFFDVVNKLAEHRLFKGVLVCVTEKYLLHPVEDIVFLNHFKTLQPDVPYAFAGCIIEDTMFEKSDINHIIHGANVGHDFTSDNLISIGLFTVPKNPKSTEQMDKHNFDMYSMIIQSSEWSKSKIQQSITEFSRKVPRFEHSLALKLSCVGRDQKHDPEQEYFRTAFPQTRLIGCYGNGELGLDHPARPPPAGPPSAAKRNRLDAEPQFGIIYSYSTVFLYIGWGKITSPRGPN